MKSTGRLVESYPLEYLHVGDGRAVWYDPNQSAVAVQESNVVTYMQVDEFNEHLAMLNAAQAKLHAFTGKVVPFHKER